MSSGSDRRRSRRFALKLPIAVHSGEGHVTAGYLNDISEGGAFVQATWSVPENTNIFIRFTVMDYVCEATGTILRVAPFGPDVHGLAIAFGFANDNFTNFVLNLESLAEARRPGYLENVENLRMVLG